MPGDTTSGVPATPYWLYLPTYTATAWYHKKLPSDLQSGTLENAVAESETFALSDYTRALMQGDALRRSSQLTGSSGDARRRPATVRARLTSEGPQVRTSCAHQANNLVTDVPIRY